MTPFQRPTSRALPTPLFLPHPSVPRYDSRMVKEHFETAVRGFQRRVPFHPYAAELVSGDRITVDHPEALVLRGGVAVFVSSNGAPAIFDFQSVSQIRAESEFSAA